MANGLLISFTFVFSLPIAPPNIIEDNSPPSVICEKQTPCTLSCHATSSFPFNYSWTKNGQVPVSDDIKIMNNIIVLTPRDAEGYGVYVCHATNSFGSTAYKITVSEGHKSSGTIQEAPAHGGCKRRQVIFWFRSRCREFLFL